MKRFRLVDLKGKGHDMRALWSGVVLVMLTALVMAQTSWSDWKTPSGADSNLEYRWRRTAAVCPASGCFKILQFRNTGRNTLSFDYTVWSKSMGDGSEDVKDTGSATVRPEATIDRTAGSGGNLVRVDAAMRR